ncbi:MAG TPA: LysR family transcriptional regulator [Solimonas sp.]|nr:LysR family transcriptional regulator [Solimonas sp.]
MHLNRIDLNLLVVLNAIYTEGGITRAADKLHLTQPAISHSLARLRELFGDALFVREGRAMVPTPLARKLIEPLRRSLRGLEVALNEVESFDPATSDKRFTLGVRDLLESTLLPPLMQRLAKGAPGVEIAAVRFDRQDLDSELAAGALDLALDVLLPHGEHVLHQRVALDRLVVVTRKRHPVAKGKLDLKTYLRLDHVIASSRRTGPGLEDMELARRGLQRRIKLRCQHYFAACRVVEQSDLILTIPERYAGGASRQLDNVILPLPFEVPSLDAYLYWHANTDNEPANRWLREQIAEVMKQ